MCRELFGIDGVPSALPSERDQNVRITKSGGAEYVLKIANPGEDRSVLEAEQAVMHHLASMQICPMPMPLVAGGEIGSTQGHLVRLITLLPGMTLGTTPLRTGLMLQSLGAAVAGIDTALMTFDHEALHRDFHWDLGNALSVIDQHGARVDDVELRALIHGLAEYHRTTAVPMLAGLRRSVIHGDTNDHNVLVDAAAEVVTGIVDFGDMVFSHTVNDLAVAMAYAGLGQPDPVQAMAHAVRGYHRVLAITDDELAVLHSLVCMRLAMSVCLSAKQQSERPGHEYLGISQGLIADTLPKLAAIHPRLAQYVYRDACGLEPVPHSAAVRRWLEQHRDRIANVVGHDLSTTPVVAVDMSVGSPLVSNDLARNSTAAFAQRVQDVLDEAGVQIGVGGYDEPRVIYDAESSSILHEERTIHVALDISMQAGTPIFAPLDGVVHGIGEIEMRHDYGPMIVLRHELPVDGEPSLLLYTLYGHLSREPLVGLQPGTAVFAGQQIGTIGAPPVNGDWWPHVHMQLITDMLDVPLNFNGVALASQRAVWRSISPDPNLLVGVPQHVFPARPSTESLAERRHRRIGSNVSVSYGTHPLQIRRGRMQYLFDETGRAYIDAYNNVAHVGHSHPRVVRAVGDQLSVLNTNTRYLQDQLLTYADLLTAQLPAPLEVCFFTASGSEANELALRLARAHTGRRDVVVMDAAYHGHSTTLIDISPYKHDGPGGMGAPEWVHTSPIPDMYRTRANPATAGQWFAAQVGVVIDEAAERGRRIGAYIAETCPSVGGQILLPDGYLSGVYSLVREAGGVCIADEVQTGFGRLGTHFWGFQQHDVCPDIVVLGKPIANGYPMGAVVTTAELADSFETGMEFFSTFGGSTAACAAALATLQVVLDEKLQAHALAVGNGVLIPGLRDLQSRYELIGDVRGSGLFLGVELVRDRDTLEPAAAEAAWIAQRMRLAGVLVGTDGPLHNVIKLRGPMPLTAGDAACVLEVFERAIREVPSNLRR